MRRWTTHDGAWLHFPLLDKRQQRFKFHSRGGGVAMLIDIPGADALFGGFARGRGVFHRAAGTRAVRRFAERPAEWANILPIKTFANHSGRFVAAGIDLVGSILRYYITHRFACPIWFRHGMPASVL